MKRSYDYSFAQEDRDHTSAISQHSFEHRHLHTIATQAAPYNIEPSTQTPSYLASRSGLGQHSYLGLRSPLLNISSNIDIDNEFQSNSAAQKAVDTQASPSLFWARYRADSGTTGLGIHCGALTQELGYTAAGDTMGPIVKTEPHSDGLGSLSRPVQGGFLDLLNRPYSGFSGSFCPGPRCAEDDSIPVLTSEDATTSDFAAFFLGSSTLSIPSLLYPSSSELALDTQPLFCSSSSESSVEAAFVNASFCGLYTTSSTSSSANNSPVRKALLYASSSSGSVIDNTGPYSVRDPFSAFMNLDSPLFLGSNGITVKQREPVVGLYADINLRTVPTRQGSPQLYVNPADVMGHQDMDVKTEQEHDHYRQQSHITPAQGCLTTTDCDADNGFTDEAVQAIVNVISAANREDVDKTTSPELPRVTEPVHPAFSLQDIPPPIIPQPTHFLFAPPRQVHPMPVNTHPSLCASVSPPTAHASASTSHARAANPPRAFPACLDHAPFVFFPSSLSALHPPQRTPLLDCQPLTFPVQDHARASPVPSAGDTQIPISNAHMGVELDELRRRADDYRACNPSEDIDKTWLQAFAGRLSEGGVLIDEWRCYVKGCAQRNKRRDHILVHVGSHVEHRPFACGRWCVYIFWVVGREADRRRI